MGSLIPKLPRELLGNYALIFQTQSIQAASLENPRVVLFSRNGEFALAFSTFSPNFIEILEFNSVSGRVEPRLIEFRDGSPQFIDSPLTHFPRNHPKNCTRCHGEDMHFNWDTYPTWPGVYGQTDREFAGFRNAELTHLRNLQASIDSKSLLNHLEGVREISLEDLGERNKSITDTVYFANAKRVFHRLKSAPKFDEYQGAILAALLERFGGHSRFRDFLSPADQTEFEGKYISYRAEIKKEMLNYHEEKTGRLRAGIPFELWDSLFNLTFTNTELEAAIKMRFLTEKLSVPTQHWWTTKTSSSYAVTGATGGLWVDLLILLTEELRELNPAQYPESLKPTDSLRVVNKGNVQPWIEASQALQVELWKRNNIERVFPVKVKSSLLHRLARKCEQLLF